MKRFNKSIHIEVSIDSIAQKLLASIDSNNPHAELIVESIISPMSSHEDRVRLGKLFSALSGYREEINFYEGQHVYCSDTFYSNGKSQEIGNCYITDVDPYRDRDNVQVSYHRNGNPHYPQWVSVSKLSEPQYTEESIGADSASLPNEL
jgi:hypothetical protein